MKRVHKIQIFRITVQIIFLFLFPALFTLSFSQFGQIFSMIIKGQFNIIEFWPRLIVAFTLIPLTILLGRFFCGWFCAFGAFNDFIYMISKKVFKMKFRIDERVDYILKYLKYIVLIFIAYEVWTKGSNYFDKANPWNAFAQITQFPEVISQYPIGLIALILIVIGAFFIERFFCRYLCPLGAIFSIVSKFNIFNIDKPREDCGKCRLCTHSCSMGIQLYKTDRVKGGECINCLKCVEACPRKNTQITIVNQKINPAFASTLAIIAFIGIYFINNIASGLMGKNNLSIESNSSMSQQKKYKDGTYTGVGRGYRPDLTVSVTIKEGKIENVEILSHRESRGYYEEPFDIVPKEIIQSQSTEVDTVSGATRSSNGIIEAVNDALSQAKM